MNHADYIEKTKGMLTAELLFVIKDAGEAMAVNPAAIKYGDYADEIHYCGMELKRRDNMAKLVGAVRAHALKHYERGGWDYIVETMDDEDIAEEIGAATTEGGAIRKVGKIAKLLGERRDEVRAEIF